ncbi:hypothetical protein C8Q76DRAFT_709044 [Earliella scabrosa]|nr:hypothetical protein C8Q76DRAFT_709044 [Earliella scabrosa]
METAANNALPRLGLDVWYLIAAQLEPDITRRRWRSSSATLARLARVCKSLTRPALSVLWRELIDPRPLGLLWATLELGPSPNPDGSPHMGLPTGSVESIRDHPNLARFREYASFVRRVHVGYGNRIYRQRNRFMSAPEGTLDQMKTALHPDPILPRLRTVRLQGHCASTLFHLLSPSIKDMTLMWSSGKRLAPLLRDILPRIPDVERLAVGQNAIPDAYSVDCLAPLAGGLAQNVRHLDVTVAGGRTLQHIARLPKLETLHLRRCRFETQGPNTQFSLPRVHALSLEGTPLVQLDALFSHVHFPALASLTVEWVTSETPAGLLTWEFRASLSSIPSPPRKPFGGHRERAVR